jgi:Tfp pilus assembly protein, ATPase PilM
MPLAVAQRAGFPGVFSFLGGSKTRTMLGVDINPERIAVAQLKKQGNGRYRLAHYHSVDMPEGAMVEGRRGSSRVDLQACKLGTGRRFTTS